MTERAASTRAAKQPSKTEPLTLGDFKKLLSVIPEQYDHARILVRDASTGWPTIITLEDIGLCRDDMTISVSLSV